MSVTLHKLHGCLAVRGALLLLLASGFSAAARSAQDKARDRAEAEAFFATNVILRLRLEVGKEQMDSLRKNAKRYVQATLREGAPGATERVYGQVGVHLKGSAGSFRNLDDKAGWTLDFDRFVPTPQRFHGLEKIHLNNSAQDGSYLSDWLCRDLFRRAGVPATRITHALVEVNGRKMGLFNLSEGMDEKFLLQYFPDAKGDLYGQSGGGDITDNIERMGGAAEKADRSGLLALAEAIKERDPERRYHLIQETLDLDRFLSFMALEVMLCHWDGYTFARHNYRAFHDLDARRIVFFPHDLDQMMQDPNVPIAPGVNGLVAQAVLKLSPTRSLYRQRFTQIYSNIFVLPALTNRIHDRVQQMLPILKAENPNLARDFQNGVNVLRDRIVNRVASLEKQLSQPPPGLLKFQDGVARLNEWRKENDPDTAQLDQRERDGRKALWISAKGKTTSAWRKKVVLPAGHYRFEASACGAGVAPIADDKKGQGAGLRISGTEETRPNKLVNDASWQNLLFEFDVAPPDEEVELVCELRATKGEVWFDLNSLRLVHTPAAKK